MKNNKKLRRVLLLWAILLGICLQPIVARAQVQEITDANFQMVGGQIRTTTPMGLRFIAKIKKDYIAQQEREGKIVEYGIVLLPEIYLDGKELTADGIYLYKGKVYKPSRIKGQRNTQKIRIIFIIQPYLPTSQKSVIKMNMQQEHM